MFVQLCGGAPIVRKEVVDLIYNLLDDCGRKPKISEKEEVVQQRLRLVCPLLRLETRSSTTLESSCKQVLCTDSGKGAT
jgi:hypothetical protein